MTNQILSSTNLRTPTRAVKALDSDGTSVGGYGVLFGSASQRDLVGEWFTHATDFMLDLFSQRPIFYDHGQDQTIKAEVIGTIDQIEMDDVGIWITGQLNRRSAYLKRILALVRKGAIGWSSGSLAHLVKRSRAGQIERWPLVEFSLTPSPAEARTLAVPLKHYSDPSVIAQAYKSLNLPLNLAWPIPAAPLDTAPQAQRIAQESDQAALVGDVADAVNHTIKLREGNTVELTQEQLEAVISQGISEGIRQSKPTKSLPVPQHTEPRRERVQVLGDVRYAGLSSQDMAFMTDLFAMMAGNPNLYSTPAGATARQFIQQVHGDGERRFVREMAAKALKENARRELNDLALAYLPYRNLEAVDSNDYRPVAIKAGELDNTSLTNQGVEWVPTIWSGELWSRVRISNAVAANIDVIDMLSNPYNIPLMSSDPSVYYTGEAADAADIVFTGGKIAVSQVKTAKATLTAKKLTARAVLSTELNEDAIIPVLPDFRAQTIRALQNYIDDTVLNGDVVTSANTNVNLIDGTPATAPNQPAYLAFDGMRKYALVTNVAQAISAAGGPTLALFRKLRFALANQYAVDVPNLICIVDVSTYQKMLALPEFSTYMNAGVLASNLLGVLPGGSAETVAQQALPVGVIDGVRVFVSAQLGLSQPADGKISNTANNNTAGTMVMYHRSRWKLGFRRQIQLETFASPFLGDTIQVMASARVGLASFDAKSASVLYNVNVS